ncbi:class E sortase [Streptomyces tremellae]|uniref:Peptidase C60 family protein n=1 Tax=Streptomyces tremellae TaxID=1124239 RepID=A0ABP7EQH4_9ACTN
MTALRPEQDGAPDGPRAGRESGAAGFEAVVSGLADPLTDPIPGAPPRRAAGEPERAAPAAEPIPQEPPGSLPPERPSGRHARPPPASVPPPPVERPPAAGPAQDGPPPGAVRDPRTPARSPEAGPGATRPVPAPQPQAPRPAPREAPAPHRPPVSAEAATEYLPKVPPAPPVADTPTTFLPKTPPAPRPQGAAPAPPAGDTSTTFLPRTPPAPAPPVADTPTTFLPKTPPAPVPPVGDGPTTFLPKTPAAAPAPGGPVVDQETVALRSADVRRAVGGEEPAPAGGRAERRKAARAGARGRRRPAPAPAAPTGRPLTRIEARQAARALKDSPGVVISRAVGELFITFGVLMLLFVTYQLWWTNVRADNFADNEASKIQSTWKSHKGPAAGAFEPGQGFAIIHIPKLDVVAPIAQGVSKEKVLDHGEVGHYSEGPLKTAMPEDKSGNFALAGHRNTHGEPFRYINQLVPGDKVVVETQDEYYTYEMTRTLPQTSPSNVGVISPIPQGSGFTKPGRYITLTTCTPEFTSTYRLIVWGKMVSEQPRSQGLPAALQHG